MEAETVERPPQWYMDYILRRRPGAFAENAKLMLYVVKALAREGEKVVAFPADAIRGGDCGSMNDNPAFQQALAAELERFLRAVAKMRNAPRIRFLSVPADDLLIAPGPDPRLPFCGAPDQVFARQTVGLAKRLASIGCKTVVIGLSGGLDSALALLVAYAAFELLELDVGGIRAFTLPAFGTTRRTRGNAVRLAEGLGISLESVPMAEVCRQHFRDLGQPESKHDVVYENAQARARTMFLMDKANQLGGIVLGTGDLSEIALGWSTYNGDHMSMYGVNAGVPKTAVREVCTWFARNKLMPSGGDNQLEDAAAALLDIVATPVSPELLPVRRGVIAQITEDRIGPYELHDFFLWHFIAENEDRKGILAAARRAFRGKFDSKTIAKWLDVFFRRLFSQAFKRNCAPDGTRVFGVYFSPDAWHVPSNFAFR